MVMVQHSESFFEIRHGANKYTLVKKQNITQQTKLVKWVKYDVSFDEYPGNIKVDLGKIALSCSNFCHQK